MRGPKPETLNLSEAEQNELKALVHRHTTPQQQALRGRMIAGLSGREKQQPDCSRVEGVRGHGASLAGALAGTASDPAR